MKPTFFAAPEELRAWLEEHHEHAEELWVGFYKKGSGKASITWREAVDEALCFGWIDGVRKRLGDDSYTNRFTPRRARSNWSAVNVARVEELTRQGRMRPAGREAFEQRALARTGIYSYEQRHLAELGDELEREFRANEKAWDFFQAQPPGYRRMATWWVVSAKKEETRRRRLATLIEDSQHERAVGPLRRPQS